MGEFELADCRGSSPSSSSSCSSPSSSRQLPIQALPTQAASLSPSPPPLPLSLPKVYVGGSRWFIKDCCGIFCACLVRTTTKAFLSLSLALSLSLPLSLSLFLCLLRFILFRGLFSWALHRRLLEVGSSLWLKLAKVTFFSSSVVSHRNACTLRLRNRPPSICPPTWPRSICLSTSLCLALSFYLPAYLPGSL